RRCAMAHTRAVCVAAAVLAATPASSATGRMYAAWFAPDEIGYAGTIHAYLRNSTGAPREITQVELDGTVAGRVWRSDGSFTQPAVRDEYLQVENDEVTWYRVFPNPVPAGGVTEIIVRLEPEACEAAQRELAVGFADGETASASVPFVAPAWSLEYVGVAPALDELFVYCRTRPEGGAEPSLVEIDGEPAVARFERLFSGLRMAQVMLGKPWQEGSYHTVAVAAGDDRRAVLLRALPSPPPLAIMGNLSTEQAREYAQHLLDVHIAFVPPREEIFETLAAFGLRGAYISYRKTRPEEEKYEPVYYDDAEVIAALEAEPTLWAHFLEDEPDGRYHRTQLSHLQICRDVERANQLCRILDRRHPTYLQMDHGGYPRNMYIWGHIPDYLCTHAYPFGRDIVGNTADHVRHMAAASRPRPFIYLCEGYCENGQRQFEPDEMRVEVLAALAGGAKSLQWYPAHGSRGLLAHPRMWNEVGRINGVLHQVLPLLSLGVPAERALVEGGEIEAAAIVCGDRAIAVVLVNGDHSSTPEAFRLEPARDVTVRLRIPRFMQIQGALLATFDGPAELPVAIQPGTAQFTVPEVGAGAIVILYAERAVVSEMRAQARRVAERFVPTPEE
ncbi:MAG: hypothetical protein AB7Y46_20290, partial [Armatimonadota bacterium]